MGRNILAGVAGIAVAVAIIWFVESVGHQVYPPPPELNFADKDAMRTYMETLPVGAFLFVGGAWFLGVLGGTLVACRMGNAKPMTYALVVGGLILLASVANLIAIPHPMLFSVLALAGVVIAAWLGMTLGVRFQGRKE